MQLLSKKSGQSLAPLLMLESKQREKPSRKVSLFLHSHDVNVKLFPHI